MQTTNHANLFSQIKACSTCEFVYRDTSRSVKDIQQYLGRNDLPDEFIELLTSTESMDITGKEEVIHFMSLKDLNLINDDNTELPFLFFFGDDRGSDFYAFDTQNKWGYGKNAIYRIARGAISKEYSIYLSADLFEFIDKICKGEDFSRYPYMEEE